MMTHICNLDWNFVFFLAYVFPMFNVTNTTNSKCSCHFTVIIRLFQTICIKNSYLLTKNVTWQRHFTFFESCDQLIQPCVNVFVDYHWNCFYRHPSHQRPQNFSPNHVPTVSPGPREDVWLSFGVTFWVSDYHHSWSMLKTGLFRVLSLVRVVL